MSQHPFRNSIRTSRSRRRFLGGIAGTVAAAFLPLSASAAEEVLRIGFQKSSSILIILKAQGTLEKVLTPLGVKVQWTEFSSGLPLLEGLNVGSIDFSADVAEPVPLFAQAAGARLTYVAQETPSPEAQGIVVRNTSSFNKPADLKGRKIAVAKGAGAHYLLLETLAQAGLSFKDVEVAFLQPADARAAVERGAVDAWVTWDPHLAAIQKSGDYRILADGRLANVSYRRFYLAATPYAERRGDVLANVVTELKATGEWIKKNQKEAAEFHAPLVGLDVPTITLANSRRSYNVQTVDDSAFVEQQKIADAFAAQSVLPKKIVVRETPVWIARR